MADTKIKDIDAKNTLVDTDELVINDVAGGNADKKAGFDDIKTYMSLSPTLVTPASLGVQQADLNINGNDVDNVQRVIRDQSTSGTDVDFDEDEQQTISISANTTFTGTNYATGVSKTVFITTDGTLRTLAFPAGWIFMGSKPADQAASKVGVLTLTCTTAAEAGVRCAYAVEA